LSRPLLISALAAGLLFANSTSAEQANDPPALRRQGDVLHVRVAGVTSTRGHVRVDVCTRSEFLKACSHGGIASATPGVTVVVVKSLPPGVYAIQAYDDRNDNLEVDRNLIGVPVEAVGFSNDAPVGLDGPRFESAAFTYSGGERTVSLRLRRFLP